MKENRPKYMSQEDMTKDLRNIIKGFKDFEASVLEMITTNVISTQNKIDNLKRYNVVLRSDNRYVGIELTPEMQEIAMQSIINKIEADRDAEDKILTEDIEKARKVASEECKSAIDTFRQQLEDKVQAEKEKLNTIITKIRENMTDLKELKESIVKLKLKPESRTFKILDKEQQEIMKQQKHLSSEKRIANENIKSTELELQSLNKIYGNINFESKNFIHDILKIMYGKEDEKADYSIFLQEGEWEKNLNAVQDRKEVERKEQERLEKERRAKEKAEKEKLEKERLAKEKAEKEKLEKERLAKEKEEKERLEKEKKERAKKEAENKKQGQETKPNPTQNPEQKPIQNPTQEPEQQLTPEEREMINVSEYEAEIPEKEKLITKVLGSGKNKSKQYPTLTYIAEKDSYIAQGENGRVAIAKRGIYSDDIVKRFISNEMGINEDELGYVDTSIVSVWMIYDDRYGTNETTKYIQSILNPNMENQNSSKITYNMKGLHSNKNIPKSDKQKLLEYANYAQEFQIGDVKKGFIASITERITNAIKRNNNDKLDKGKSGAEIIAEDLKNREARKRENKFKQEIQVTSQYNDIGRQISKADKDGLDSILANAREELREGKISTTEYSGLMYNANNRRKELSSAKPTVKKDPAASTPQQESADRG